MLDEELKGARSAQRRVAFLFRNLLAMWEGVNPAYRRTSSCAAALLIATSFAALLSNCSSAVAPPPPNVILITIDTLRADRLGCYGNGQVETPTMDGLARDGVLFERAIAQVPLTTPSHAAILTGTYPIWNGMRDWSDPGLRTDVPTLAEIFRRHGYSTAAFVSAFVLDSMWGLNRGFDHYDDWFKAQEYVRAKRQSIERPAEQTVDRAIAWLQSRPPGPFFLWVHLYDPHAPYQPPEPFKSRYAGRLYDGEIAYTDQQLGRVVKFLRDQRLYSSALIALTSDHGEALGEHQEQEHGYFIYEPSIHVPLLIKFPAGFAPARRRISEVVNTIDVAPTLTQFCAFPSDELRSFQGRSLLTLATKGSEATPRYGYSESLYPRSLVGASALYGLQTERYHYIRAPHEELYDLQQDPEEKHNVLRENPAVAAALRGELQDLLARYKPGRSSGAGGGVDPETAEKLRSLGYVSLSVARPSDEFDSTAPDPKDLIGTYNEITRAIELSDKGEYREAGARLAGLARKHPKIYLLPFLEGENLRAAGDARGAIVQYRRALAINPLFDQAAMGLGRAAYAAEENSEAAKAFDLALQLNPRNFQVRLALARVYWRLGRLGAAAAEQLKVLDSHPNLAQARAEYGITMVRLKRYTEALTSLAQGIEGGFRNAEVYNFQANAYAAEGRSEEAIHAYEQAISLDPKYATAYVNLALIYDQKGQREKSREYYQKACRLSPELCRQLSTKFR